MESDKFKTLCKTAKEWDWATDYVRSNVEPNLLSRITGLPHTFRLDRERLISVLIELERLPPGQLFISRLKNALRQFRYRSPSNGRESCSFMLSKATKTALKKLAKLQGRTEVSIIESLINDAAQDEAEHRKRIAGQKTHEKTRRYEQNKELAWNRLELEETKQHLEAFIRLLASYETVKGEILATTTEQQMEAAGLAQQKIYLVRQEIKFSVLSKLKLSPLAREREAGWSLISRPY